MGNLESLLNDLANLDAQHDLDGLRRVRADIARDFPDSEAAAEAHYKLGLDALFRSRNVNAALASFEEAVRRKHPFWSAAARTSLGLCLYHQKRTQKALLELRKVAHTEPPTVHSVTALTFLETIFQAEGQLDEVRRARKERITQLERMVAGDTTQGADRGQLLLQLGIAKRDAGDAAGAKLALDAAKAIGPEGLGADLYRAVVEAAS